MRRIYLLAVLAMGYILPTTQTQAGTPTRLMTATIGDFVWRDLNSNGIQDAGEPGLSNVYVELQTSAGGWVNAVFTDANGAYSFTGVAPGSYKIKFANPGGFFQSPQDAGSDDTKDNDADINGFTAAFSVVAGQVVTNIDAGFKAQNANTCSLTIVGAAGNKICNDNGTPANPADDQYTFSFTATVTGNPNNLPTWGYKFQINNMTFYGMYGMPLMIGPLPISSGNLTWTLVDDDNPTCSINGTVTPPNNCSPGGNCATAAVRTITNTPTVCGAPGVTYGFWFSNLNANLSQEWLWESGSFIENSDGTATLMGVIKNKTKVNAKFAVDLTLTGRTFTAPAGSPKTISACSGTATSSWYYYTSLSGHLTGLNDPTANELAGASLTISGFDAKPQFGTGASLRNPSANGGSSWMTYTIGMQPVNTSLQLNANPAAGQGADFNFELSGTPLTNCATTSITMNCTNNITVTAASGATSAVVNYTAPTATSTCTTGSVSVVKTSGLASGSAFPVGTSTVVYTATDGCGNVKTCSFTVTVNPGTPVCDDVLTPGSIGSDEVGCPNYDPAAITQITSATGGSGTFEYVWLSSTTGCPTTASQQIAGATGATYDPGPISQTTWYVRCVRRAGCTSYVGANHESNCVKKEVSNVGCGGNTPNCTTISITVGNGTITIGNLSAPIVSIQVFNSSWTQVYNCPGNCTLPTTTIPNLPAGVYYVKVDYYTAAWSPICQKDGYFTVPGGNTPVLTMNCTNDITVTAAQGATSAVVNYTAPTATSTCTTGSVSVVKTSGLASGSAFPVGTSTVVYTASDGCGNVKTCSFTVTVTATPAAVLTFNCTANSTITATSVSGGTITWTDPTATSTCTTGSVSVSQTSGPAKGSTQAVGTYTIVYTATDGCGNSKTCSFTVTVVNPTCLNFASHNLLNTPQNCSSPAGAQYGFYFAGLSNGLSDNFWVWESGSMVENSDGTASINGVIKNNSASTAKFTIALTLTGRTWTAAAGSPKTDANVCSGLNTSSWYYYQNISGTATGSGLVAGGVLNISEAGPNFQIGTGASLRKNAALGASSWLGYTISSQPTSNTYKFNSCAAGSNCADINMELSGSGLTNCAPVCNDVTSAGVIGANELGCPPLDPAVIAETTAPAGGSGAFEYVWLSSTTGCPTTSSQAIAGATGATYDPGPITQTTWYVRCVRRAGCTSYVGAAHESNCVKKEIKTTGCVTCNDVTSPGVIGADELGCAPLDPAVIAETTAPAGGSGAFEYVWLSSTTGCPTNSSQAIAGATGATYDPGPISQTTWYLRCVRRAGCTSYVGAAHESNCVKKEIKTTGCGGGGTPNCSTITVTVGPGSITIGNLNAPVCAIQVYNWLWSSVHNCPGNCTQPTTTISNLLPGIYHVKVDYYTANWQFICQKTVDCTVVSALLSNPGNNYTVFDAYRKNYDVQLKWLNNTGEKNDFFDVERSTDGGQHWTRLDRVDGKGPKGDPLYFQTFDREPTVGDNFYRLKNVWRDGTVIYSDAQLVNFESIPAIALFPNPTADDVKLDIAQFAGEAVTIRLINPLGLQVFEQKIAEVGVEPIQIDLSKFATGQYFVRIENEQSRIETRKLVITRF